MQPKSLNLQAQIVVQFLLLATSLPSCGVPGEDPPARTAAVRRAVTATTQQFRDDFHVDGFPNPADWVTLDGEGPGVAVTGGNLVLQDAPDHKRVNTVQLFSPTDGGIRASASINLTGDYQKFGLNVNHGDVAGGTGFYFDTSEAAYGGASGSVRAIVYLDGSLVSYVAIPVSWGTPHLFEIVWTATNVSFFVDGQELSHVATNGFSGLLPVGVWNDRASRMEADWVQVAPLRKKIVILFQGIRTSLQCDAAGNCLAGDQAGSVEPNAFAGIRSRLVAQGFLEGEDIIWFSYSGGNFDPALQRWIPNSYDCAATGSSYAQEISTLRSMLSGIADKVSAADFYLVGHSQGGLLALQSLGVLSDLSLANDGRVRAVITLDSPLGGNPPRPTRLASDMTCWKGPAVEQLISLYQSNPLRPDQQGDNARPLCRILGVCPNAPEWNWAMVQQAVETYGVEVMTYGNQTDGVYAGSACHVPRGLAGPDNVETQVVFTAGGGLSTGPDFYSACGRIRPRDRRECCISSSHSWTRASAADQISGTIGAH